MSGVRGERGAVMNQEQLNALLSATAAIMKRAHAENGDDYFGGNFVLDDFPMEASWLRARLVDDDATVYVQRSQARGRLLLSGCIPERIRELGYGAGHTRSITVTETITPERLARELERRLMEPYREELANALVWERERLATLRHRDQVLARAVQILGGDISNNFREPRAFLHDFGVLEGERIYDDGVRIRDVSLTEEEFFVAICAIADLRAAHKRMAEAAE